MFVKVGSDFNQKVPHLTANKKEGKDINFEKDRERFCNEEEGRKYVDWIRTAEELTKVLDKQKEKEDNKELYDEVEKLKKLSVPQVPSAPPN